MSKKTRTIFFLIGLLAIVIMIFTFDLSWEDCKYYFKQSGYYLPMACLLWAVIYFVNTLSWKVILRALNSAHIPFLKLYKFTISGFALNYVTPGGLNGGEPYRILELRKYLGVEKATSSTILYSIAHIGSHLLFWMLGALLLLSFNTTYWKVIVVVLGLGTLLLFLCYLLLKKGVSTLLMNLLGHVPFLKSRIERFVLKNQDTISLIDDQVRVVYKEKRSLFISTISLELLARCVGCLEILLIPTLVDISYAEAYLVVGISSLMGNLLFFMPMQLGGREGGFVLAFSVLGIGLDQGLFVAILFRARELLLIIIGIALIQLNSRVKS